MTFVYLVRVFGVFLFQERIVFSKLSAGSNRDITIWVDTFDDNCLRYSYEATNNKKVIAPMKFIGCNKEEAHFRLLVSRDHKIVGIIENEKPQLLLAVHDFGAEETCLREKEDDKWEETIKKR